MPCSTSCAVAVPGDCCLMSFPPGQPFTTTSVAGNARASGSRSCRPCACRCASKKAEMLSQAPPSLTANRSKPVRFAAPKRATTRGKKIWGRKRHLLVDTQGHLLGVKVLGADGSDQAGAKTLLLPLKDQLPKLKLVWGDSHYGGTDHSPGSKSSWAGPCSRCALSPYPSGDCWYPRESRSTGTSSSPPVSVRCPEGGWWSGASP